MKVACVLVTHLRAKVELRRQPHLRDRPAVIVDRSGPRPVVVDHLPACRGVASGMTLEHAMSRQGDAVVLEADESSYRGAFNRMLASLQGVSDRVERSDLGAAYVGLDGLEDMYGGEARLVNALLNSAPQDLAPRVGVAHAKFPALVAAMSSTPLGATKVPADAASFLAPRSLDLLPIASTVKASMRRFGLHVMGDVTAMSRDMLAEQFGPAGGRAWDLSHGIDDSPLVPLKHEEAVVERTSLPFSSTSMRLLLATVETLLRRAYSRPEMQGRCAGRASLECVLDRASPWEKSFHFKQGAGSPARAYFIISNRLETDHPQAPVEEVALALSDLTGESGIQMGLLPDVRDSRERRLVEVERQLQARTGGVSVLRRVTKVAPGHPRSGDALRAGPCGLAGKRGFQAHIHSRCHRGPGGAGWRSHRGAYRQSLAQDRSCRGHLELRPVVDAAAHDPNLLPG